jgi:hypothetical protein
LKKQKLLAALALSFVSGLASAAVINTTTDNGNWSNTLGGPANIRENVSFGRFDVDAGDGYNQVRWGTPFGTATNGRSGLGFLGIGGNNVGLDTAFQIGSLRHYNWTIGLPGASSSDLAIEVGLNVGGNARGPFNLSTTIKVDETPNSVLPCPFQPSTINCSDRISFEQATGTDTFTIDGIEYTFDILGFGPAANQLQNSFISQEAGVSEAPLWAKIVAVTPQPTPEPDALALLALGLGGLTWVVRRNAKR